MNIKIDKTDAGCCATDCPYKKPSFCALYNEELIGTLKSPTRCGKCHSVEDAKEEQKFEELQEAAQPLANFLAENYDLMTVAIVTYDHVDILRNNMGTPLEVNK